MKLIIATAFGLESVVAKELERLGYEKTAADNGRIALEGTYEDICRLNLNISAGERVMICANTFKATSFDELFEGTKSTPWEKYIPATSRKKRMGDVFHKRDIGTHLQFSLYGSILP